MLFANVIIIQSMKSFKIIFLFVWFSFFVLMTSCAKEQQDTKQNILLICVDDLRPELKSFGANYIIAPNIDQLAKEGISFQKHFVNAPSCGPSRYTLLTGQYGTVENDALFLRAKKIRENNGVVPKSMPEWFKSNGYTTVAVGKVSHHPGGRGGVDWNDSTALEMPNAWDKHLLPVGAWKHPRGVMHGLANGEIRINAGDMDVFQHAKGSDNSYPDGLIANEAISQLEALTVASDAPFFLAVGIIKPHLPFGAPKSYYDYYEEVTLPEIEHPEKPKGKTTWHPSGEFMKYNRWDKNPNTDSAFAEEVRRHYAAAISYADAQIGKIMSALKRSGAYKNTIVVLWGDHGWHLGEHAIWGKHSLFEESLHSPLIIRYPKMKNKGFKTNAIVETLDLFPTLTDLAGIETPSYVQGVSLRSILLDPSSAGHMAFAYKNKASTIRTATHRLILHKDGFVELYNHQSLDKETVNVADQNQELVDELKKKLKEREDL